MRLSATLIGLDDGQSRIKLCRQWCRTSVLDDVNRFHNTMNRLKDLYYMDLALWLQEIMVKLLCKLTSQWQTLIVNMCVDGDWKLQ